MNSPALPLPVLRLTWLSVSTPSTISIAFSPLPEISFSSAAV